MTMTLLFLLLAHSLLVAVSTIAEFLSAQLLRTERLQTMEKGRGQRAEGMHIDRSPNPVPKLYCLVLTAASNRLPMGTHRHARHRV